MRELEEYLREASHRPLPEAPPAGGFAALRQRMVQPHREPAFYRSLLWVLGVLVAASGLLYLSPGGEQRPSPTLTAFAVATPSVAGDQVQKKAESYAHAPVWVSLRRAEVSRSVDQEQTSFRAQSALRTDSSSPVLSSAPNFPTLRPVATPRPAIKHLIRPVVLPVVPTESRNPFDTLPAINPPTLLYDAAEPLTQGDRGHWDVGVALYGTPFRHGGYTTEWSETEDPMFPGSGRSFVLDRQQAVTLYAEDYHLLAYGVLHPVGLLRLHRQTSRKLRYGLGVTYFRGTDDNAKAVAALRPTASGRYFTSDRVYTNLLLFSADVGWTFRPQARLQLWVGVGVQLALVSWERGETYLVRDDERYLQSRSKDSYNYLGASRFPLLPTLELGLQYRLSARWSAGLNIGAVPNGQVLIRATPGAEVRYRW